jgi:hypothetical protein
MLDHIGIEVSTERAGRRGALVAYIATNAPHTQRSGRYSPPWKTSGLPSPLSKSVTSPVTIT